MWMAETSSPTYTIPGTLIQITNAAIKPPVNPEKQPWSDNIDTVRVQFVIEIKLTSLHDVQCLLSSARVTLIE